MTARRLTRRLSVEPLEERAVPAAGDLDLTFGAGGVVTTDLGSAGDAFKALALAPGGDVVAGGCVTAGSATNHDFGLARYLPDGSLDATFGSGGRVQTAFGSQTDAVLRAVAVLPDGRVLGFGSTGPDFALVRYTAAGAVDPTFGGRAKGKVVTDVARSNDRGEALAVQADGKVLAAGLATTSVSTDLALVRYNPDGSLDTTFDGDGKLTGRFSGPLATQNQNLHNVALAVYPPDAPGGLAGKVLAAVMVTGSGLTVARFNPDGSRDASFGGGTGLVTFNSGGMPPGLAIQPDGKFVLSARGYSASGTPEILLARFDAAGTPDPAFGTGGVTATGLPAGGAPTSLALEADGRLVVAGWATWNGGYHPFAARYTAGGQPDLTFGASGMAVVGPAQVAPAADPVGLAVQADGRIVLGGTDGTTGDGFVLARFQGDSALTAAAVPPSSPARHAPAVAAADAQTLLAEAIRRWAAAGADVSGLAGLQVHVADLGGATLGLAAAGGIWVDDDAAGWGWFVDATPSDDSEFLTPGDQGERNRMDLLSALEHEVGHLLGHDHAEGGVMSGTLAPGERLTVGGAALGPGAFAAPLDADSADPAAGPRKPR